MGRPTCAECGAPVRLWPDGDPRFDPSRVKRADRDQPPEGAVRVTVDYQTQNQDGTWKVVLESNEALWEGRTLAAMPIPATDRGENDG